MQESLKSKQFVNLTKKYNYTDLLSTSEASVMSDWNSYDFYKYNT